jgi:hypothetical protein
VDEKVHIEEAFGYVLRKLHNLQLLLDLKLLFQSLKTLNFTNQSLNLLQYPSLLVFGVKSYGKIDEMTFYAYETFIKFKI